MPDIDLGQFARVRMAYGSARQHQGVADRRALSGPQLVDACAQLRLRAEAAEPAAIVELFALLSGIPSEHAAHIALREASTKAAPVIAINVRTGQLETDMHQICLAQAAQPPLNGTALPASHLLVKPLPRFLTELLRIAISQRPLACSLGELFPCTSTAPTIPVAGSGEGRLRATPVRISNGLSVFAIELGLDHYDAALITDDFALIDKSRLFYVRSDPARVIDGCRKLYAALGWGEPEPCETLLPFGSRVVPSDESVRAVYEVLRAAADTALPGRRYTLDALIEHHNRYALLVAWLLGFCTGAREAYAYDFNARTCRPGALFVPYVDKPCGPFKQVRPVLLCRVARELVGAWWRHLAALLQRTDRLGLSNATLWVRHLRAALAGDRIPLFVTIHHDKALAMGSAGTTHAVPHALRLVPNAGRHFWQTTLYRKGVPSSAIDVYARHACRGTEPLSSTSLAIPLVVHRQVCAIQDAVLRDLGITPVAGLGRRAST
ncbi:MAG: hypothetical protein Tsb007_39630 [Rhizobacter sp.]